VIRAKLQQAFIYTSLFCILINNVKKRDNYDNFITLKHALLGCKYTAHMLRKK